MPELFTWTALASVAGTIAASQVVATLAKALWSLRAAATRYIILATCVIVQALVVWRAGVSPESVIVGLFNAGVLALGSMGLYEKAKHGWAAAVLDPIGDESEVGPEDLQDAPTNG